jgi:hypothetical protein
LTPASWPLSVHREWTLINANWDVVCDHEWTLINANGDVVCDREWTRINANGGWGLVMGKKMMGHKDGFFGVVLALMGGIHGEEWG